MTTEIIKLIVRPNASRNSIDGIYLDRIKIRISSPPEKGRANKELIKFISEKLGIPKKNIKIISGNSSNLKEIEIRRQPGCSLASRLLNHK
jgi:uncharacterized protein (TIGR00251 family)